MIRVPHDLLATLLLIFFSFTLAQPITQLDGVVEIRSSLDSPWQPAHVGDILSVGSSIRTFQGNVELELEDGVLRLNTDSELDRQARNYKLIKGQAYTASEDVSFFLTGPAKISGQARIDVLADLGQRLVILEGLGRITHLGRIVDLPAGEQLVIPEDKDPLLSNYFERDPWYRNLVTIGEGSGRVIGFQGEAEITVDTEWKAVELNTEFAPGNLARTGEDSWLEIRFDDGNLVRLQEQTEINLNQIEEFENGERRTLLLLNYGKIWAVANEDSEPFEIETPGLVAGVRGTTFRVDAADNDEPPLLKTFEGNVAGIVGFEVFEVAESEQFDPLAGLAPLKRDALDDFNLERDRLITPPPLSLVALPSQTQESSITLQGMTDPNTIVQSGAEQLLTQNETFQLNLPLRTGFNLIELSASYQEEGAQAYLARPIVKTSPDVFFGLSKGKPLGKNIIQFRGVAQEGSIITASSEDNQIVTRANAQGRFSLIFVRQENEPLDLSITISTPQGNSTTKEITFPSD